MRGGQRDDVQCLVALPAGVTLERAQRVALLLADPDVPVTLRTEGEWVVLFGRELPEPDVEPVDPAWAAMTDEQRWAEAGRRLLSNTFDDGVPHAPVEVPEPGPAAAAPEPEVHIASPAAPRPPAAGDAPTHTGGRQPKISDDEIRERWAQFDFTQPITGQIARLFNLPYGSVHRIRTRAKELGLQTSMTEFTPAAAPALEEPPAPPVADSAGGRTVTLYDEDTGERIRPGVADIDAARARAADAAYGAK